MRAKVNGLNEMRPCIVTVRPRNSLPEKKKALFHCFEYYQEPVTAVLVGETSGQYSSMNAIVELENGKLIRVDAADVQMLDPRHSQYDFRIPEEKDD